MEFEADPDYGVLGWPFGYDELKPYYDEATGLLGINTFKNEPELQALLDKITKRGPKLGAPPAAARSIERHRQSP